MTVLPASAVSFVVQRGPDNIEFGNLDTDFNFLDADMSEFYHCPMTAPTYCQAWKYRDVIYFQFLYSHVSAFPPIVRIFDANNDVVFDVNPALIAGENYRATIRTIDLPSPGVGVCDCYSLHIGTIDPGDDNFFACCDSGTFEAGVGTWAASSGGNNTLGQSVFGFSHSGDFCGKIIADPVPAGATNELVYCNAATTYTTGNYYYYTAWVYSDSGNPPNPLDSISFDMSDITDAEVLYSEDAACSNVDSWRQIKCLIKINAVLSGTPKIVTGLTADANAVIYIDDISYTETNIISEAISQTVCICDVVECSAQFFYYPAEDLTEFGILGANPASNASQSFNVNCSYRKFKFDDNDHVIQKTTAGVTSQIISRPDKIYTFKTGLVPRYMVEKITHAMKFSNVLIRPSNDLDANGVYFVMYSKAPNIEWEEFNGTDDLYATVEWEMVPRTYPYQKSNC